MINIYQNKNIEEDIVKSYKERKRLLPFVGSGFSANIDGFPTWNKFVEELKSDLDLTPIEQEQFNELPNVLEKTEYYIREMGKKTANIEKYTVMSDEEYDNIYLAGRTLLVKKIEKLLGEEKTPYNVEKWECHRILVKKFKKMIYTTNWDNTLERKELKTNTEICPVPNYGFSKMDGEEGHPRIIKYHGDCSPIGDKLLVACLTDYQERMTFKNCLDIKLQSDMLRYDFLLIGYSLTDPNIQLMIHNLSEIINGTNKLLKGRHLNTKLYLVSIEKMDDVRINLINDTYKNIVPYFLLDDDKYFHEKCITKNKCKSCSTITCKFCGNQYCNKCGDRCRRPKDGVVREKTINFLNKL
jgi:hypothetical protein